MIDRRTLLAGSAVLAAVTRGRPARAQTPVRIGLITTLSTPAGYIGQEVRDAFQLAIDEEGGRLGGMPVQLIVEDDSLKPAQAKQSADRMLQEGVRLLTGITFSNVLAAVVPGVVAQPAFYVSTNPGPSGFAGKGCNANYFVASYQNDVFHEASGLAANDLGYRRMAVMAPNYQAGRDAITGFKRRYAGEVTGEIYTKLDQTDFSVELGRLRELKPDAFYQFQPGGPGINLAKQYANSGLAKDVPMLVSIFSMDARGIEATGDASDGFALATSWTSDLDNPANRVFVAGFRKAARRVPTIYAAQAYDTAKLIASALRDGGDPASKPEVFRAALRAAKFESVRGRFRFAANQHPILDFYLARIEKAADGSLDMHIKKRLAEGMQDSYGGECQLPA